MIAFYFLQNWDNDAANPQFGGAITVTPNGNGSVVTKGTPTIEGGVTTTPVTLRISESDMASVPAAKEAGEDLAWKWYCVITPSGGDTQRYVEGPFVIGGSLAGPGSETASTVTIVDETITVEIDGAAELGPMLASTLGAKKAAEDAATLAGRYANADTDEDIPGASAGERGAKFYRDRTQAIFASGAGSLPYGETNVGAALDKLLYVGPAITALSVAPATAEVGQSVDPTISYTVTGPVTAQTLNGDAVSTGSGSTGDTGVTADKSYTLAVTDGDAPAGTDNGDSAAASITFLNRRYWGASDSATLDSAGVVGLASSELSNARVKALSVDGGADPGKYIFFAYPAALGDPASYKIFGFDEEPIKTTVSVTTAAGATLDYIVLRSPEKLTGTVPVEIG
ncbi:hypothetical protein [Stakelama tenebrarum]|uniref:Uncharacterized protein n=1 Tax=Stakelama tenebrarum TaxID=2711215 RepID=A0A6G6Y5J8_9SPHN|nr:hypothetical protein [Sphingosinithalassobacter tenebrarum]QIG80121.1 hypothetical protein G5C33_10235 [Sphingosinithalassobacter tenebrarum]